MQEIGFKKPKQAGAGVQVQRAECLHRSLGGQCHGSCFSQPTSKAVPPACPHQESSGPYCLYRNAWFSPQEYRVLSESSFSEGLLYFSTKDIGQG